MEVRKRVSLYLTDMGLERLNLAIAAWEEENSRKCTTEEISQLCGLDRTILFKIRRRSLGVSLSSIQRLFSGLNLSLEYSDYGGLLDDSFVGRQGAIADIITLTVKGNLPILILGEGGVGKTELAHQYFKSQYFDKFLELKISKETLGLESVKKVVGRWLRQDFQEEPGQEFEAMLEQLKQNLKSSGLRIGILIDDLDLVLDSSGKFTPECSYYGELLRGLGGHDSRSVTLITSRERLSDQTFLVQYYLLGNLTENAWEVRFKAQKIQVDQYALKNIHRAYGGNALAMELLCRAILEDYQGSLVAYWRENQDNLLLEKDLEDLVSIQFDRLQKHDPIAYKLLCRIGCYKGASVPREGILCLLWDVPEDARNNPVKRLLDRSLIDFSEEEFVLNPVIQAQAADRLHTQSDWQLSYKESASFWTRFVARSGNFTLEHKDQLRLIDSYQNYLIAFDILPSGRPVDNHISISHSEIDNVLMSEILRFVDLTRQFLVLDMDSIHPGENVKSGLPLQQVSKGVFFRLIKSFEFLNRSKLELLRFKSASSRISKLVALASANDILQELGHLIESDKGLLAFFLISQIIERWKHFLSYADVVGQIKSTIPAPNPYVVGNPVSGSLFVGRDDILARIEELWRPKGQLPSILLYGHRRMGKTSILQNLTGHLGPHTTLIDFNMQRVGMVNNPGKLLHNLALALYDSLPEPTDFPEPTEVTFTNHNPYNAFDRFLRKLNPHRHQTRYIIALDEFELLEQRIDEGRLDRELLTYLRSLINTYPWFILALAGLHSLQEMTHDYWSPLFGNVTPIPVSFLSSKAATNLITNPTDDFPIDYDPEAIAEIYSLTGGQPYLLQLICHNLVSNYNHQRFEDNIDIEPSFSLADVQTIINSPTFFSQGHAYFSGIWSQASEQHGPTQQAILRALSQPTEVELLREVQLLENYAEALVLLQRHDIIHRVDDRDQFVVPLMERWVAQQVNSD